MIKKFLIILMMSLSGLFIFLAIKEDREAKMRKQHVKELNKHFDEMMRIVNRAK